MVVEIKIIDREFVKAIIVNDCEHGTFYKIADIIEGTFGIPIQTKLMILIIYIGNLSLTKTN